jgi:cytochrome c553
LKALFVVLLLGITAAVLAAVPTTLNDFFLPGSQPGQSGNLDTPDKCDNCHGGYDQAVEPAFTWRGSMMAQAARDPLFYASVAIANQDAPESGDLCIRCHAPDGWLQGRSIPTDGTALNNNDRQGVQCDFCHKLVKPTPLGVNPYPDDPDYTSDTYPQDQSYLSTLNPIPGWSANGMYIADANNAKRGPFVDADANHQMFYSPFHSDAGLCGTCHDVSNPAFTRDPGGAYVPNSFDQPAPDFDPRSMFPVERTFSEWLMSAYNTPEGVYAPQFGGNKDTVSTCQDCHMRDVTGEGCNKQGVPTRTDLPLHDQTGGNTFIPLLIESLFPGEADTAALNAGIQRATYMLQNASTLTLTVTEREAGYLALVQVTNETGHKLPSGYPEGRRTWLNVKAYDTTATLIYESGAYDPETGVLTHDPDLKIYEIKPGISEALAPIVNLPAGPSFHFVLNDTIYRDNRIPPRGFTNANFETIQSPPVDYSYADGQHWDDTEYLLPDSTALVVVTLYYQTTSKEYVEFLRDENVTNDWGTVFYDLWAANGKSPPVAMATQVDTVQPYIENQPPMLDSIGSKVVDEGQTLEFRVSATDPDGDSIILSAEDIPANAAFLDSGNGAGSFHFAPSYLQAGQYLVTFIATDTTGRADSQVVEVTVTEAGNQPPVLAALPDSVEAWVGDTLTLHVYATDPEEDVISLSASGLPTNSTLDDSGNGGGAFIFAPDSTQDDSVYLVTFIASDGALADSQMVVVSAIWFIRGDANGDGKVGAPDVVYLLNYLFHDGPPPDPLVAGDCNCDGQVSPEDVVYLMNYLFRHGPPPECP